MPVGLFDHSPCCSVSVWPWATVPTIVGGPWVTGAGGSTTVVCTELAGWLSPPRLVAVSCTAIVSPTSEAWRLYVAPAAPAIGEQPESSQSSHWYAYALGG